MIDRAVESAKEMLATQETFKDRMEETLDAVKEAAESAPEVFEESDDSDDSEDDEA